MDTGKGYFQLLEADKYLELIEEQGNDRKLFRTGEEVELKGSRFKVHAIKKNRLILKLLPSIHLEDIK